MSADYPNREDWLRIRNQKRMRPRPRLFHLSADLVRVVDPGTQGWHFAVMRPGKTYRRKPNWLPLIEPSGRRLAR